MEKTILEFKSDKLTKEDNVALMLLGGDCVDSSGVDIVLPWQDINDGDILYGVDSSDGIDQDEVDIINDFFDWLDLDGEDGYLEFHENGSVEAHGGEAPPDAFDQRIDSWEWNQWKQDNGYQ